jgi:bacterioferritin-associated ferredoxin
VGEPAVEAPDRCPDCGRVGRKLDRITLKALLRPGALARFGPGEHRFCPVADCPVVYFGRDEAFRREEVLVPVFQKEVEGGRIVCYCFGVSEDQIRREVETSGASASAERIKALVQSGRCACEVRNPQGTCCLGNVIAVARPSGSLPAPIPSELVSSASPE